MTSLATQHREVTAKQGVWEGGAAKESNSCSTFPFPLHLRTLGPNKQCCFSPKLVSIGCFYINKQTASAGTSSWLAPSSSGHSTAKRCRDRGVPPSQGKGCHSEH